MTQARSASERIVAEVTTWTGVEIDDGELGELAFTFDGRELGHLHGDYAAHFSFPKRIWTDLVAQGRIVRHPVFPDAQQGPAAREIHDDADVADVIELLRLNYDRLRARRQRPPAA
jgi:hypothetical protein